MNDQKQDENGNQLQRANMGMKIAISVLPSIGLYTSDDARLCVHDDDDDDLPAFANRKFQSEKK